ncbi:MAG: type II/IV secretion system protein, partial [Planctomyces sp.]
MIAPVSNSDNLQPVRQLAARFGMLCMDLEQHTVDLQLLQLFPVQDLFRESVLPLSRNGNRAVVAVADPLNLTALQELTVRTGLYLDPVVAAPEQIQRLLKNALGLGGGTVQELMAMSKEEIDTLQAVAGDEIGDASQASSVVKLVNELLLEAIEQK